MSLYVLDTDILTLYRRGHGAVCRQVAAHAPSDLAITVLTAEEQLSGWYTSLRKAVQPPQRARAYRELAESIRFLGQWPILDFPETAMARAKQLLALKLQVRKMDLCIAAIVLEKGGILVTQNFQDFQRVPGLALENWAL
jgi:tRNA(fMet)-specific endonuclease VapC